MINKAGTPHYETAGAGIQAGQVVDLGGVVIFIQDAAGYSDGPVEQHVAHVSGTMVLNGDTEVFIPEFEFTVLGMVEVVAHMPTSDWSADYARRAARENRRAKAEHINWQREYGRRLLEQLEAADA